MKSKILLVETSPPPIYLKRIPLILASVKSYIDNYLRRDSGIKIMQIDPNVLYQEKYKAGLFQNLNKILSQKPRIVVFFLEDIAWSMVFNLGVFVDLSLEMKKINPKIKVILQTYKLNKEGAEQILEKNKSIDTIILGDPEKPIIEIIKELENKQDGKTKAKRILLSADMADLNKYPSPFLSQDLDEFLKRNYQALLYTKRGCTGNCFYCFRSVKFRSVECFPLSRVIKEMLYLWEKGIKRVLVIDDCFVSSDSYLLDFVRAYKKVFKERAASPRLTIMCRPEQLSRKNILLLKLINIHLIQIGVQTLNEKIGNLFGGKVSRTCLIKIMRRLRKADIKIWLDLIIGLPGDNVNSYKKTLDFTLKELRPDFLQIKQLYLNPFTRFDLEKEKFGLSLSAKPDKFHAPFVQSSTFKKDDIRRAFLYTKKKAKEHPKIKWKVITQFGRVLSLAKNDK